MNYVCEYTDKCLYQSVMNYCRMMNYNEMRQVKSKQSRPITAKSSKQPSILVQFSPLIHNLNERMIFHELSCFIEFSLLLHTPLHLKLLQTVTNYFETVLKIDHVHTHRERGRDSLSGLVKKCSKVKFKMKIIFVRYERYLLMKKQTFRSIDKEKERGEQGERKKGKKTLIAEFRLNSHTVCISVHCTHTHTRLNK